MANPIDPHPTTPLIDSYTYHSPLPKEHDQPGPSGEPEQWVGGIDEAGRGPVLGPMVYAAAFCPISFKPKLETLGFDDSKALSTETRASLWNAFNEHPELCYTSNVISPQDISKDMLKRVPFNLNRQAEESTIALIRDALNRGINLTECFVDALGPAPQWQARLSQMFPTITFVVVPKADSIYKIVGAASIIAKVTRDRLVEGWIHPETLLPPCLCALADDGSGDKKRKKGKGKVREKVEDRADEALQDITPRKKRKLGRNESSLTVVGSEVEDGETVEGSLEMIEDRGSGYPSDPKTQTYLKAAFHPIFGYPSIVRFSWAGVKVALDKDAVNCKWIDEPVVQDRMKFFEPAGEKGKPSIMKEIGISSIGEL